MKKIIVDEKYDNKRLDKVILQELPYVNINTFYKTLRKKDIKVNNLRVNCNVIVHKGDELTIYINDNINENKFKLDKLYEDENIIIIDKPIGIEVTGKNSLTEIVHNLYKEKEFKPMPCHRLDRNTIGLILYAKNKEALEILQEKFKSRQIEKHYLALVYGNPRKNEENLTAYLFKDNKKSKVYISDVPKKGYTKIITKYKVLNRNADNTALLDVEIKTGKTHQIRAHLAYIGIPIIGDGKYGINKINQKFKKKYQMLISYKIKFAFTSDSGILNYLNQKEIVNTQIDLKNFNK